MKCTGPICRATGKCAIFENDLKNRAVRFSERRAKWCRSSPAAKILWTGWWRKMPSNSPMSRKGVESVVLHKLEVNRLHTALSLLTPEERALIQALFFDKRKESELAVELGIVSARRL